MKSEFKIKHDNFILEDLNKPFLWYITNAIKPLPHLHYHMEIMFVIEGSVNIILDSNETTLYKGDIAIIFPYQIHYGTSYNAKLAFFIFTPDILSHMKHTLTHSTLKNSYINKHELSELALFAIDNVIEILLSENICSQQNTTVIGMLYILLTDIFEKNELQPYTLNKDIESIKHIFKYIDENYTKKISLTSTAEALGLNPYYLSRIFSNYLNISFSEYITNKRLLMAHNLICSTNKTILDIMYETGYKSERTFYRCFKEYFNMTPMQLRNTNQV